MGKISNVSAKEAIKAFRKIDFEVVSQVGSHIKMRRTINNSTQTIIIPNHKQLKTGTLVKGILRPINLTQEDFLKLLS
ncbi:hypothetical protein A2634_02705 [Candidatus Amesbacteria bacterium RIFCSPHIGHO2_01_FULL_48_32]|uniref:Addiction module toxin, HicA family n=1 Tax=Candidatus Amesbacteria bacterium RIFCSPLOWO2_01_FULL_48_25 TaxID=1797259 RepID=A0A1F4ZD64_9BACT|nr:MAG: hypothetical protein A2634_02705 [Candidatus Amesbacteria bacterium RIFCSPHIGHO2_01_FULL_48_32]OGD04222.1 MAG: hypothetical protein A2989_01960 [Candidatus Amesbacteria bacterium RIFCSPLOWO2_01_FULL_48_25]